jgi:uroporphyrin-III C-methyltransferase/precorrin-2 dehydrogenase/sirohydrochlorin ferrochelatase
MPGWSIAATDDPTSNRAVAEAADARRMSGSNVVDDAALSTLPGARHRVERGPLQIAISSGGGAPMLARHLRARAAGNRSSTTVLRRAGRSCWRGIANASAQRWPDLAARRRGFERLLAGPLQACCAAAATSQAERAFDAALRGRRTSVAAARAHVALVGAGPGDPGLLTLNALRASMKPM